jgi:uracil permease
VPAIVGNGMTASAALFGAGVGTLVYQLFTKFNSPVFLGSSFAFLGSMFAAFAGAASVSVGYIGLIIGAVFAGLVYVILALIVKFAGVGWIDKLMPPVIIGPIVAIIGLSLAGNAVGDMMSMGYIGLVCALVTLFVVILCSVYGGKGIKLIPFIIGIAAGYVVALVLSLTKVAPIIDLEIFKSINGVVAPPQFSFIEAWNGIGALDFTYILTIFFAYVPVAFVVFAEHLADHKNLSTIINQDLTKNPGLHRTLLGDGIGSMAGAFFGGCPNTTYGESIGCVAITGNASVITITAAALLAIVVSFIQPLMVILDSIPACVMGGVCMTLYGFIAVSGLKMLQPVDLNDNRNLFTASVILIAGVGGLSLSFITGLGEITITTVACALILGIITNLITKHK